ncbi:hypothetical protein HZ993_12805 [Rhodoferax sp. AJA081-3]|uniref:hypothetical protein n=1 Tax=Rhodoferax sp. AJA081-3 TaxID=2752316 RepID=UPI001ADF32FC|nr:hypothetical protein [Rhodoferax sp. AJA081-3]QTN26225.1 hypothetical protein HZ993_12805 [Rhodoferax sp. AJA081-3]
MSEQSKSTDAGSDTPIAEVTVPDDFPRDPFPAALSGTQAKFAARLIDGRYVVGLTPDERAERYLGCLDLVDQLTAYVNRKALEKPELTQSVVLDSLVSRMPHQGWNLGNAELAWMEKHLRARFSIATIVSDLLDL